MDSHLEIVLLQEERMRISPFFRGYFCFRECPEDVFSFAEWGRTAVQFGKTVLGEGYYAVAHGVAKYFYYMKWARVHLERKSLLGRDFVRYLAVKERYFGTPEDDASLRSVSAAQGPTIPGTTTVRQYVAWTIHGMKTNDGGGLKMHLIAMRPWEKGP